MQIKRSPKQLNVIFFCRRANCKLHLKYLDIVRPYLCVLVCALFVVNIFIYFCKFCFLFFCFCGFFFAFGICCTSISYRIAGHRHRVIAGGVAGGRGIKAQQVEQLNVKLT